MRAYRYKIDIAPVKQMIRERNAEEQAAREVAAWANLNDGNKSMSRKERFVATWKEVATLIGVMVGLYSWGLIILILQ